MRKPIRFAVVLCTVSLVVVCGCGRSEGDCAKSAGSFGDTLVDAAGRVVAVPRSARRVISPFTMYTRLIVAMGGCDKLAGISHICVLPEEQYACGRKLLDLPDVGPFGANMELIASLAPDLIFASRPDVASFAEKTDATVVAVSFPSDVPMLEMFDRQIDIIGKSMGMGERADSLKQFMREMIEPVVSVTTTMADSLRPRAYFAWTSWTGDILNTVCDFDPIELAGGRNVAGEADNFPKGKRGVLVSREHIIRWNPEVIFVSRYQPQKWHENGETSPMPVTVEEVLGDPLLASVDAIRNRKVYYTTAFCNWWPHQRALAQILYMARIFHPERFADLDVEKRGNAIFKRFYGADSLYTRMAGDLELVTWD